MQLAPARGCACAGGHCGAAVCGGGGWQTVWRVWLRTGVVRTLLMCVGSSLRTPTSYRCSDAMHCRPAVGGHSVRRFASTTVCADLTMPATNCREGSCLGLPRASKAVLVGGCLARPWRRGLLHGAH